MNCLLRQVFRRSPRHLVATALAVLIAASVSPPVLGATATVTTNTLPPLADAYVRDGSYASANFGLATPLEIKTSSSGQNRDTYLKFTLPSSGSITSAVLRFYAAETDRNASVTTTAYAVTNTTWTETGLTWNNKPARGAALGSVTVTGTAYTWYTINVTAYVQALATRGSNTVSFALHNPSQTKAAITLFSKEAGSNQPMLILTLTDSAPSVTLLRPTNGAVYAVGSTIPLEATATDPDGSITRVEFFDSGTRLGEVTTSPFMFAWSNAPLGAHTLTAKATDASGTMATSAVVRITVVDGDSDYDGRSNSQELGDGTDPFNPASVRPVRLGYWRFNDPAFMGEQGQVPLYSGGVQAVPSWSGLAARVPPQASCTGLQYREVETNGAANINLRNGSVRFWFKPDWNSTSNGIQGGPRTDARLIEMGGYGIQGGWWALALNPDGTGLYFASMTNLAYTTYLSTPIHWSSKRWYQLVLSYTPTNTALYIDWGLAASDGGVVSWPSASVRSNGFRIGFDWYCTQAAGGQFEELETFNYPLTAPDIATNFATVRQVDMNLNGRVDLLEPMMLLSSAPFSATPFVVAGTIEAEHFDQGGQTVSYFSEIDHRTTDYRETRLAIERCDDLGGGYYVGHLMAGDWMRYTFEVRRAGAYTVEARVAADAPGGQFVFEFARANGTAVFRTVPLTISQSGWQTLAIDGINFDSGTNTVKILMVTNAANGEVGRGNYISIYPTVPPFVPQPGALSLSVAAPTYGAVGDGNPTNATRNRMAFQKALNDLMNNPAGGVLFVPAGTYFLNKNPANSPGEEPGKTVRNNLALEIGRPFLDPSPASNIEIRGDTAGESILQAADRSTTLLYVRRYCCLDPAIRYTNFFFNRLTFKGNPHLRPDGSYDPGAFNNYATDGSYSGGLASLLVFWADDPATPVERVNVFRCRFINPTLDGVILGNVQDFAFTENQFRYWDGEALPVPSTLPYSSTNGFPIGQVGIFGSAGLSINIVVQSNYYTGNPNLVATNSTEYSSDGLLWLQAGGNWFAASNTVVNYGLEAVQMNAGPGSVTRNRFVTQRRSGSTTALLAFGSGWMSLTPDKRLDLLFTMVGNDIVGGREAYLGRFNGQSFGDPLYNLSLNGNAATLYPPIDDGVTYDSPSSLVWLANCDRALVSGNTLRAAAFGFRAEVALSIAEILKNDFSGSEQISVVVGDPIQLLQYVIIAKNVLSSGRAIQYGPTVLNPGGDVHLKVPYVEARKFFLIDNVYVDDSGRPNALLVDPPQAPVNIGH